ncbi:CBU_0592 family membrane protein [Arachidicoccus terrestris]|uniref:CBU_0592 family membrane protein n=1 Tax=Arachidicoccus terrestris TaxID=2875539 RepID=UPI001CC5FB47|nr:hypothetical protein [Arachidicoccus terrestris]UAY55341.1 hypothetical protein K9M52_18360 [Arachidicoccus terrestris]
MNLIKLSGWLGVMFYLVAYLLLVIKKLRSERPLYHILNILGAIGLLINAWLLDDYPNLAVNIVWAFIAVYAIIMIVKRSNRNIK